MTKFVIVAIAVIAAISSTADSAIQKPIYRPPIYRPPAARPPPRPIRVRRQIISGSASSNPAGGIDTRLQAATGIGTPNHNLMGGVFAAGNTNGGPVATGGTLAYNNNGHGLSLTKEHIPGVRDSFTQAGHVNLLNSGPHKLDANAFASQNKLANGFKFDRNGGGLDYSHANGHGLNAGISRIPQIGGTQYELGGRANLWQSVDRNTRLDLTGSASKWSGGPFSGKTNYGGGLGLSHSFG